MSTDPNFPTSHTTSTTTKVVPLIWFDQSYLQTTGGLIKAISVVVNLVGFICATAGNSDDGHVKFFSFTSMTALWLTLILLAFYLFHVIEKLHFWPWLLIEFVFCLIWTSFYFLSSLLIVMVGGVFAAAGFFGFIATFLYGYDAFIKYKAYSSGEIAQGERTTTASNPA